MSSSILWITGTKEVEEFVYKHYGFGYWTGAFDVILEKHGYLDFDKAPPSVLERPDILRKYNLLIVSWLPTKFWKTSYLRSLRAFDGIIFLEGPFPRFLEGFLGLERINKVPSTHKATLMLQEPHLQNYIRNKFTCIMSADPGRIEITPKVIKTKSPEFARHEFKIHKEDSLFTKFQNICLSYMTAYKNRLRNKNEYFPDPLYNAITVLSSVNFLRKLHSERLYDNYYNSFIQYIDDYIINTFPDLSSDSIKQLITQIVWIIALYEASALVKSKFLKKKFKNRIDKLTTNIYPHNEKSPIVRAWNLYLASSTDMEPNSCKEITLSLVDYITTQGIRTDPIILWLLCTAAEKYREKNATVSEIITSTLKKIFDNSSLIDDLSNISPSLENLPVWKILLLASVMQKLNFIDTANRLFHSCNEACFDTEKGSYRNGRVTNGRILSEKGYCILPWIPLSFIDLIPIIRIEDNASVYNESYPDELISAWNESPVWFEPYKNIGGINEAVLHVNSEEFSGFFRRGRILGCSFQLLSYLVYYHTMPPLKEALLDCPSLHVLLLESILFYLIDKQFDRFRLSNLKVHSWPWKKNYCVTIRHDVDRIPEREDFDRLLNFELENRLKTSWFWIPERLDSEYIQILEQSGYEIGLHSMKLKSKKEEITKIQKTLNRQVKVFGEAFHGGGGGDYWQGYTSVKSAINAKLDYTEGVPTIYNFPYSSYPVLNNNGSIGKEEIICLTHNASTDKGSRKGAIVYRPECLPELSLNGFYCLILNHPDINFDKFRKILDQLPKEQRISWTCCQTALWWKSTHQKNNLRIEKLDDTINHIIYQIRSKLPIQDLEIRLSLSAEVTTSVQIFEENRQYSTEWESIDNGFKGIRIRVNLSPDTPVKLVIQRKRLPRYEEVFVHVPNDTEGPQVSPNYHLPRVTNMVQVINNYTGYHELNSKTYIADIGCGYGPFTIALHIMEQPKYSIGLDLFTHYINIAKYLIRHLNIDKISFIEADMTKTADFVSEADILIINNAINYLTTRKQYKKAIRSFYNALKKDGFLVILTPNKLYYREAFTKLIGVQFMPRFLANWYVRYKGRRDHYNDIRLPSPFELKRWIGKTGFREIKIIDAYTLKEGNWKSHFKPRFYLLAKK